MIRERLSPFKKGEQNGAGLINVGIYVIDHSVITEIPAGKQVSLEENVFPQYLGHSLRGFLTEGFFIDIGIPWDYERAQKLLPVISSNSFNGKQTI